MSAAGPSQGANRAPAGGSAAAPAASVGAHHPSAAGPSQGANRAPAGGSAAAPAASVGAHHPSVRASFALLAAGVLAGCAAPSAPVRTAEPDRPVIVQPAPAPAPAPMVEYPPIEPVEPPLVPGPAPSEPASAVPSAPAAEQAPAPATAAPGLAEPTEEQQLASLLGDLQRYASLGPEDLRLELATATQALARQRTDFNRIRLAVLYTLAKTTPQDDQRALQLLDNVAKNNPGSPAAKQLAAVLQAQVAERLRAVREEQQKSDAAVKKLEALRLMERDLLRDRIRGGGGGTGGGSSGGGGGGGGGG